MYCHFDLIFKKHQYIGCTAIKKSSSWVGKYNDFQFLIIGPFLYYEQIIQKWF